MSADQFTKDQEEWQRKHEPSTIEDSVKEDQKNAQELGNAIDKVLEQDIGSRYGL